MIRFQLKPRFTQNPCSVSPLRVFPSRLSLQCAGFDSAHASRNMRMFFYVPIPIVVLAIGLLCHSYTFYVPIPHTGGLSIHLLLCRTPFTRATFLCMAFSKNLGSQFQTLVYANTLLCVKARLPTKQNADSQKTTCFKCFTEAPCFTQHLEKSCSCFALLS